MDQTTELIEPAALGETLDVAADASAAGDANHDPLLSEELLSSEAQEPIVVENDDSYDAEQDALCDDLIARVLGEEVTELPKDLYIPPGALRVFLEAFEGGPGAICAASWHLLGPS